MMEFNEALNIIKEANLIVEFIEKSLSRDQMIRMLGKLNPSFDPAKDIKKNQGSRKILITLKSGYLDGTEMGPKDFTDYLQKYGWNLVGYTKNSLVIAPLRLEGEYKTPKKQSKLYREVLEKTKGWYLRFSNIPPEHIKKYGFRTTKDRNIESNDQEKSGQRWFNQERVYVFSLENSIKTLGNAKEIGKIFEQLHDLIDNGQEYGDYAYLIKLPSTIPFRIDPEYDSDKSQHNSAGFVNTSIPPQYVKLCVNYSRDVFGSVLDFIGLKDAYAVSHDDFDPEVDQSTREFIAADKSQSLCGIDLKTNNDRKAKLEEILKYYNTDLMVLGTPTQKGTRKSYLVAIEAQEDGDAYLVFGGGIFIYCGLREGDDQNADLSVLGWNTYFRDREVLKSKELLRFLSDDRVVALAKDIDDNIHNRAEREFDPRNGNPAINNSWSKWR